MLLPSHQFEHFYRGGDRIGALRGGPGGPMRPEEWIGSVTTRYGAADQGLSRLPDGTTLRERVLADPRAWLGAEHVRRYGDDVGLLVKLLDPDQRLPVHVHPSRAFAREHLGLTHGKTEAWVVLAADEGALVGLGFRREVSSAEVAALVAARAGAALVDLCRQRSIRAGDGILVPAGTPHFIGAGCLIAELQEPTDLSILLEWDGFAVDGERDAHLGLGFDVALGALDRRGWTAADVERHVVPAEVLARWSEDSQPSLLPALVEGSAGYFRAHHVRAGSAGVGVPAGFAILLVLAGEGSITTARGTGTTTATAGLTVRRGDAVLVPWAAGDWTLTARVGVAVRGVLTRPPAPDAPRPPR